MTTQYNDVSAAIRAMEVNTRGLSTTFPGGGTIRVADDIPIQLGTSQDANILWETKDANANVLLFALPTGGTVNVPVVVFGDASALDKDLSFFNGITAPGLGVVNADESDYLLLSSSGTIKTNSQSITVASALRANTSFCLNATSEDYNLYDGILTVRRDVNGQTAIIPTVCIASTGIGDNTNFYGIKALHIIVADASTVTISNKGVLYGANISVKPRLARNNSPADDVVGVIVSNDSTDYVAGGIAGIEAFYVGKNASFTGSEWAACFSADASATKGVALQGTYANSFYATSGTLVNLAPAQIGSDSTAVTLNAINDMLLLQAGAGGSTIANNFGVGIAFYTDNNTPTDAMAKRGYINFGLTDVTKGSETGGVYIGIMEGGALSESFTFDSTQLMIGSANGVAKTLLLRRQGSATSSSKTKNSNTLQLQSAYWTGSANSNKSHSIQAFMDNDTGPIYYLSFYDSTGTYMRLHNNAGTLGIMLDQDITLAEGVDFTLGTTTGTKIGASTSAKLGFWGVTPVVQQVFATGASHTVDELITMLQTIGLCKQS